MTRIIPLFLFLLLAAAIDAHCSETRADALKTAVAELVAPAPRHRLNDEQARDLFVSDVLAAGAAHDIDPVLIITVAFFESSLNPESRGSIGEIGLMQVHGQASEGCQLDTQRGQLECGARWLRHGFEKCGDWSGAITMYATGQCHPRSERIKRIVRMRIRLWEEINGQ